MAKLYFINLDSREDRLKQFLAEVKDLDLEIERVPAIYHKIGAVGCARSHIKALNLALEQGHDEVIIAEDDNVFERYPSEVLKYLGLEYPAILLSYHVPVVNLSNFKNGVADVSNGQTTNMYLVKREYIPKLIESFGPATDESNKRHAIDQLWKPLQKDFKAAIPRVSKQIDSYSDIEKKKVSYGGFLAIGILSCNQYDARRKAQNLDNCPFIKNYFIGNGNSQDTEDCIKLDCEDGYEYLPDKTKKMLEWHLETYPQLDYILKTDDDVSFDFERLHKIFVNDVCLKKLDYAGYTTEVKQHKSWYHKGKTAKEIPAQDILPCSYASGGGYFLSRKAMELVVKNIDKYKNIYEDYSVGYTLQKSGIRPTSVDIRSACIWT